MSAHTRAAGRVSAMRVGVPHVLITLLLVYVLSRFLGDRSELSVLDLLLGGLAELSAVGVCVRAVCRTRFSQVQIMLGAGAVTSCAAGHVYYALALNEQQVLTDDWISTIAFLAFYPLMLGALTVMMWQLRGLAWPILLDSVVGAFAAASLMALILTPLLTGTGDVLIVIIYPLLDLLLISAAGGLLASRSLDLGPRWPLLIAGLILFSSADLTYALAVQDYAVRTQIDVGWTAGLVSIAIWVDGLARTDTVIQHHGYERPAFLAPVISTATALAVLLVGCQIQIPFLAQVLASSTLALAAVPLVFRNRLLSTLATTDELTKLPNRRALLTRVPPRLREGRTGALFLLDLDRFKDVNDALGHDVGDALLVEVGKRFAGQLRPDDLLTRLGGDEFAVFLDGVNRDDAVAAARQLETALAQPIEVGTASLKVNASIGIALTPADGTDLNMLMRKADIAMFRAKSERSGNHLYSAPDDDGGTVKLRTLQELRTALLEGQFELHYQPKVHLRDCEPVTIEAREVTKVEVRESMGVEALLRWNHPVRGQLPPASFLPLAEEAGLMPELTTLVLERSLVQAASWYAEGLDISIAVNIPSSCIQAGLLDQVRALLEQLGMPAACLMLEITEEVLMSDPVRAAMVLRQFRIEGVQISIDDFGTGYSSLAYLRDLPVDELKLDRSFITAMRDDERARGLVGSIINLAHSLGLRVVAEGVDDERTVEALRLQECDLAQGFYFTEPLPAADVTSWITTHLDRDERQEPAFRVP